MRILIVLALVLWVAGLIITALNPTIDLAAAGLFFDPHYQPVDANNRGFWWRELLAANLLHETVQWGARVLAVAFAVCIIINRWRKAALFMLIALLLGPGLVTNPVLKDNWGRARPVQVQEFGGAATFTPALQPTDQCVRNCSFVSGDGALGFYLHSFFYIVPPAWRRRAFALGFIGGGLLFGGLRVGMGAHFLSDVLWSGGVALLCSALVYAAMYGRRELAARWRALVS